MSTPRLYGLMAEFASAQELVDAARRATAAGYTKLDAYTPFPLAELDDALRIKRTILPKLVLAAGATGMIGGYLMQLGLSKYVYALNIGGRPLNTWVNFLPITFEATVLLSALTAVFGMLALNGFPNPYHPVFNVRKFAETASTDGFFLCLETADPEYDHQRTLEFLKSLKPVEISEVPA